MKCNTQSRNENEMKWERLRFEVKTIFYHEQVSNILWNNKLLSVYFKILQEKGILGLGDLLGIDALPLEWHEKLTSARGICNEPFDIMDQWN